MVYGALMSLGKKFLFAFLSNLKREIMISELLFRLYGINDKRIKNFVLRFVKRVEGGELYSSTLRRIFRNYHKVEVGMYSIGGCFTPGMVDKFTKIGRYCSIAQPISIRNRNHPMELKSMHAFFFNPKLKISEKDFIEYNPLTIGNDVWLGQYSIITPSVKEIGHGAVVGAGAVVNKNIPPYAVVVGNPGRVVRYRFSKEVIDQLLASKWWEKSIDDIKLNLAEFQTPYEEWMENLK